MAQQLISIGAVANDGTGDTLRDGGDKINDNFTELYGALFRPVQASQAIAANDFVNIYDNAGDLRVRKADASDPTKFANGFAPAAIALAATGLVAFAGLNAAVVAVSASQVYLDDAVPGGFTAAPPSTAGHIVQPLGPALEGLGVAFTMQPTLEL
jgi:hypothetical protein